MKTVLVTGGAGFLGAHLCRRLLAEGHEVVCVDDLSTGSPESVAALRAHDSFVFERRDVSSTLADFEFVDEVYNLACPASPIHYQRDPIRTTRTSVLGALNALALAEREFATILQASTSEVYGDPLVHPQRENYLGNVNPTGPRACYDEGKRCAESLFFDYERERGVSIRVARIFNTYGPGMRPDDGRVISNLIVQALRGEPLTIFGDGKQTRSFCYVDDLIDGLLALMARGYRGLGPINLGNPAETTVAELAEIVLALTGSRSPIERRPLPTDDPVRRLPAIDRARDVLGWAPRTDLHTGLLWTIEHFEAILARGPAAAAA